MKILRSAFKFTLIALGVLLMLIICIYGYSYLDIRSRMNKTYNIQAEMITVTHDSLSILRGERLVKIRACAECHGADLSGNTLNDDAVIGRLVSRNLTKGRGGLPDDYAESDWLLALKHGIRRDGKPLLLMPSHELSQLSEIDLADIIAYCSQLAPVDHETEPMKLGPLGYILSEFGLIPLIPAEFTDHTVAFAEEIVPGATVAYGKYLATICINCHHENMKGGDSPVPGGKPIADISSTGNPGKWTHEQFISALHTGVTPEGKTLNPAEMPWTITKSYTDEELTAIHLYLQSLK